MTACFADTFFFVALLAKHDDAHERASAYLDDLGTRLVTTAWVLTELANTMAAPGARERFLALLRFLRSHPLVSIVPASQELFDAGVDLYAHRLDKAWSLTDCISFVVMEREGLTDALTGDRHFEQAGYTALLK